MSLVKRLGAKLGLPSIRSLEQQMDDATPLVESAIAKDQQARDSQDPRLAQEAITLFDRALDVVDKERTAHVYGTNNSLTEFVHAILREKCMAHHTLWRQLNDDIHFGHYCDGLRALYMSRSKAKDARLQILQTADYSRAQSNRFFWYGESNEQDYHSAMELARETMSLLSMKKNMHLSKDKDDTSLLLALAQADLLINSSLDANRGLYVFNQGMSSVGRYQRSNDDIDLLRFALHELRQGTAALSASHPNYAHAMGEYLFWEATASKVTKDAQYLEYATKVVDNLDLSIASPTDAARLTISKSVVYAARFEAYHLSMDLQIAVEQARRALEQASSPLMGLRALENASVQLVRRAEENQSLEDVDEALHLTKRIIILTNEPDASTEQTRARTSLALLSWTRYCFRPHREGLEDAQKVTEEAIVSMSQDVRLRTKQHLSLTRSLLKVYNDTGLHLAVLEQSIKVARRGLIHAAASKQVESAGDMAHILATLLFHRYSQLRNMADLTEAVDQAQQSLEDVTQDSIKYAERLGRLATVLHARYTRSRQRADLDNATKSAQDALSACQGSEGDRNGYRKTLSSCLHSQFQLTAQESILDEAIVVAREVLQKWDEGQLPGYRARSRSDLALYLQDKFLIAQNRDEQRCWIDEAISVQTQCVNVASPQDPDLIWFYCALGGYRVHQSTLTTKAGSDESKNALLEAIRDFEQGLKSTHAGVFAKIRTASLAASCHLQLRNWKEAAQHYSQCIGMFQRVSPLALEENDRQERLGGLTGISTRACIAYIMLDDPAAGIAILEAGRGIMATMAMRQHDRLPALAQASPSLHQQYIDARQTLSSPLRSGRGRDKDPVAERHALQLRLTALEQEIRQIAGLENFNTAMSASQIQALADRGPLVSFCSVDSNQAFALLVSTTAIKVLPLPQLTEAKLARIVPWIVGENRLSTWLFSQSKAVKKNINELLAFLWDAAVKPVLAALSLLASAGQNEAELPRIWWISSGVMALMPLHAAGKGKKLPLENTYAHVVSSYVSTFSALAFARQCQAISFGNGDRPVISNVTLAQMPETPGDRPLLSTEIEANGIREVLGSSRATTLSEFCRPSARAIHQHLLEQPVDVFHYSGHAESSIEDPSQTSLLFGTDPSAPTPDFLPIEKLRRYDSSSRMSTHPPQLAYLSACCTALHHDIRLLDESIHLAAIFQAMGFSNVIGTLWEANDKASCVIAREFYKALLDTERQCPEEDRVARALHTALRLCREHRFGKLQGIDNAMLWANFMHFGP